MSTNLFYAPLTVPLRLSGRLTVVSCFITLLALVSILNTGLSAVGKGLLLIALLIMIWLEYLKQQRNSHWRQLQHDTSGNWWLVNHAGQKQALTLGSGCYFSMYLAVVHGHCFEHKVLLWLWRYQYPQQTFRRLSLYLRGGTIE